MGQKYLKIHKELIKIQDIVYCIARSNYTLIITINNGISISTRTLKTVELSLDDERFIRINRGITINKFYVKTTHLENSQATILLINNKSFKISRRKLSNVKLEFVIPTSI